MKILFWNTHKNTNINSVLSDIIIENSANIIVLAEFVSDIEDLLTTLSLKGISMEEYSTIGCERIKIIGNNHIVTANLQTDHTSFQVIDNKYILCGVHLNSKIFSDDIGKREILISTLIRDVQKIEKEVKTKGTIIVGDLNINPYEDSCINARYFHALPIYEETKRGKRIVASETFEMFYNPMWNFLGDFNKPYGTYYHNNSGTINTYWNIYDQVLIRPNIRDKFINESRKIITKTERINLLDEKGYPNKNISDHLPIIFEIKED